MRHIVVLVATAWGPARGGINVFNTGLAHGLESILTSGSTCLCFVTDDIDVPPVRRSTLEVRQYDGSVDGLTRAVSGYPDPSEDKSEFEFVIVGHDVHTGNIAFECAAHLASQSEFRARSVLICHMDYKQYSSFKGRDREKSRLQAEQQRDLVLQADEVFAVGPLLASNFQSTRTGAVPSNSKVHMLIPGAADIDHQIVASTDALRFFFAGRLNQQDDRIKNGKLAIEAIASAYDSQRHSGAPEWKSRGQLTLFGVDSQDQNWDLGSYNSKYRGHFLIEPMPYENNQASVFDALRSSHIALMPSWHEGFGLTGWEAVCGAVPLICGEQSGLSILLDNFGDQDFSVNRESVTKVKLVGVDDLGAPVDADIENVRDAILEMIANYGRRKSKAINLAEKIRRVYTWEGCARSMTSELGITQTVSEDWSRRRTASIFESAEPQRNRLAEDEIIDTAIEFAATGQSLSEWSQTCLALNVLSDRGEQQDLESFREASFQLEKISKGIELALTRDTQIHLQTRLTGRLDVYWRFMSAASKIEQSFKLFWNAIPKSAAAEIISDSFLRRELLYYCCTYASDFIHDSKEFAISKLAIIQERADDDPLLQCRIARLATVHPGFTEIFQMEKIRHKPFFVEIEVCESLQDVSMDLSELLRRATSIGPTALALENLRAHNTHSEVGHIVRIFEEHNGSPVQRRWRGDKRLEAGLLTVALSTREILDLLHALATDEEEAIRWSSIDLAFSEEIRSRLFASCETGLHQETTTALREQLGSIVDTATHFDGCHPWLQREFLILFQLEHTQPIFADLERRFTLNDFPLSRRIFGPRIASPGDWVFETVHPEVQVQRIKARESTRRILLVLPPINFDAKQRHAEASKTTTPPLGLGYIASHLASLGHDVEIADCHKFPYLAEKVVANAIQYDWIGFNVVISTIRSTFEMLKRIRRDDFRPLVVVGGPAISLSAFQNGAKDDDEQKAWDFELRKDPEINFGKLVEADSHQVSWPVLSDVGPNPNSVATARLGGTISPRQKRNKAGVSPLLKWAPSTVLDRRIFDGPDGTYEPNHTRALKGEKVEAHVVMTRGCDWNCVFCTERRDLSGGERRRDIDSVIAELGELARRHDDLGIQFVDDNLLPQIAAIDAGDLIAQAKAIKWTEAFLKQLLSLKVSAKTDFGWRGIFRLEDFLCYEKKLPGFLETLRSCGCKMLAFGVEYGNEKKRKKQKVSKAVTNTDIENLFARLRCVSIESKAYFILGGRNETISSTRETIDFALRCGASLAYFALYKDFVPAAKALRSEAESYETGYAPYLSYNELAPSWDALLRDALDNNSDADVSSALAPLLESIPNHSDWETMLESYHELQKDGFSFSDLVKYNDYHSDDGPSQKVLEKVTLKDQESYFAMVTEAYLRFYLRPTFVENYRRLIENGY